MAVVVFFFFFFFQAEDGIRDYKVTGVQTCALPIWGPWRPASAAPKRARNPAAWDPPATTVSPDRGLLRVAWPRADRTRLHSGQSSRGPSRWRRGSIRRLAGFPAVRGR